MKSRETKLASFTLLALLFLSLGVDAQTRTTAGDTALPSVTLPSDLMNRELTTLYNRQLRLTDYSHKITIINIFASWCGPCRLNLTDLLKIKQEYLARDVEVIGLVPRENDPDIASVRRFVRLQQINFPVVWEDGSFSVVLVQAAHGLAVLPQSFIIGKDGRILRHFQGFNPTKTPEIMREVLNQVGKEDKLTR